MATGKPTAGPHGTFSIGESSVLARGIRSPRLGRKAVLSLVGPICLLAFGQPTTRMYDTEESAARLAFGQPTTRMYDTGESAAWVALGQHFRWA